MVCNKKRKPIFIKWKWNHIVFSTATFLSFHPVLWLVCINERLCLTRPHFLYVWLCFKLFFCFYTVSPYVRIYRSFDIFCTIGTVLDLTYFSTAVASAGWFFFFGCHYSACIKILGNHIFSLFYRRVWLGSMLDFPYESNTRLVDIFWVFLTLTILWQSSASFWSVRSGSFSNFDKTLRLIYVSFADTRPCANIRHLKLSADNSPSLKSSQILLTTEANPK